MKEVIIGISPFSYPDPGLVKSICRAGGLGVLDLGQSPGLAQKALDRLTELYDGAFGVRVSSSTASVPLPQQVQTIILPRPMETHQLRGQGRMVLVQVCSLQEALQAVSFGIDGLIAKGNESGGRVGSKTTFVLLQEIVRAVDLPVWAQGGIGLHTAAAAMAASCKGIVLDSQLALFPESSVPPEIKRTIEAMDGSETDVIAGYRIYSRPGVKLPDPDISPAEVDMQLGVDSSTHQFLAVGQDGAFAKPLANRFHSISSLLKGLQRAYHAQIRQARLLKPLTPHGPLAQSFGITYPIAQGPMSSVSDIPAFARAVADAGGLPFIALSLLEGEVALNLLKETKKLLAENPWGVGLMGFVPAELHNQQVALLQECSPSFALIAGGRPSQAQALEKLGIKTFLHVPSPGLLELFLKQGARRFVFEGRECGGHVGPRASFVLWESATNLLLESKHLREVDILFAGGIHDALSGAMISSLATPLLVRGAKVGVLMGTAYLFTEEAVTTGAIPTGFQQMAIDCHDTILLQTGPGHATRAIPNPYVDFFREERERLEATSIEHHDKWTRLESLNLGRLRIAAKGQRMVDGRIQPVDDYEQKREGLYMIGQVGTLIDRPIKMVDLHRRVSEGSASVLIDTQPAPVVASEITEIKGVDIAIVGMACIFPQANDLDEYWRNILLARNCITEVPDGRWNKGFYYDPKGKGKKTPSKWGGFLSDTVFEPAEFGIPPRSLAAIDPVQLLSLLTAKRALQDAGIEQKGSILERIAVFVGADAGSDLQFTYALRSAFPQIAGFLPPELDRVLPTLTEDSFPGILINVIAGRITNRLNLGGANYTVNAACASSFAALDSAYKELSMGYSDVALVGGVDLHNSINDYLMFASVYALSSSGECRTFDSEADGTVLGEGIAFVVLKRLEEARRDGDRIYCVIKGIGSSSDGRQLGLTAPNQEGQIRALRRAYQRAFVSPCDIELLEAHGTGTVVGDRAELSALTEFMYNCGATPSICTLGSVKSQIGHTKCAAGLAGLIKSALSIYHRVLPPTRNLEAPNSFYDPVHSPFIFHKAPVPWVTEVPRSGVSALGFGGTNFHVVLESHEGARSVEPVLNEWPVELFLFRGIDRQQALKRAVQLEVLLEKVTNFKLRDIAASVTAGDNLDKPVQFALVADSLEDLRNKLVKLRGQQKSTNSIFLAEEMAPDAKIAFLFPGQGSQRPDMLAELFVLFPQLRSWLKRGRRFLPYLFPKAVFSSKEKAEQKQAIRDTHIAQPTLGMAGLAMADLISSLGIRPVMVGGHSYGELLALTYAESIGRDDILDISCLRAESILQATQDDPGTMAAVSAPWQEVQKHLNGLKEVVIANINSPQQTVISGTKPGVTEAVEKFLEVGLSSKILSVACAFHSKVVEPADEIFASHLDNISIKPPQIEVWSNVVAGPYPKDPQSIRELLSRQITSTVRFEDQIRNMYRAGARIFIEVGPSDVLTGLVNRILKNEPHHAVVTDQPMVHGLRSFLEAMGKLATLGIPIDPSALFRGRQVKTFDLDAPVSSAPTDTAWLINGQYARPLNGDMPKHGWVPNEEPIQFTSMSRISTGEEDRRATVLEYLQSMREMIESQRQVMLGYLGETTIAKRVTGEERGLPIESRPLPDLTASQVPMQMITPEKNPAPEVSSQPPIQVLIEILSERTGYPKEMLDLDLDLEADLGIDSIKRIEILALMGERLGIEADPDKDREMLEDLARVKTLRGISDWLDEQVKRASRNSQMSLPKERSAEMNRERNIEEILLKIVADRTGYPKEMLDPDLDLEADLGIDSIKRLEIVGNLNQQLTLWEGDPEDVQPEVVDELARQKTLRSICEWIVGMLDRTGTPSGDLTRTSNEQRESSQEHRERKEEKDEIKRLVPQASAIEEARIKEGSLKGRVFAITEDGHGIAKALRGLLTSHGARVKMVVEGEKIDEADGILHLSALDESAKDPVKSLFDLSQQALSLKVQWILSATALGGTFGLNGNGLQHLPHVGVSGFLKSLAREAKGAHIRVVDLNLKESPDKLAEHLYKELLSDDKLIEVGYDFDIRHCYRPVVKPRTVVSSSLELDSNSVLLVTGGARGITARVSVYMAQRFGCKLELIGRTPIPDEEEYSEFDGLQKVSEIRRAIIQQYRSEQLTPSMVEQKVQAILKAREIQNTFRAIRESGVDFSYHSVDVRDKKAFGAVIDRIYKTHGRLDGVIHGAGVVEDKWLMDKTLDSFERVFDTKVKGALTLIEKMRADLKFLVFFSSASSIFGNQGQVDYAAANDFLDKLALYLSRNIRARLLSVNWGPWSEIGMVSPELQRAYQKRGVGLIAPEKGVQLFIEELIQGNDPQVILMAASGHGRQLYE